MYEVYLIHVVAAEWHPGMVGMPISDEDLTSQIANGWKRLNTLGHYSIPDQAKMKLVSRHQAQSLHSDSKSVIIFFCTYLSILLPILPLISPHILPPPTSLPTLSSYINPLLSILFLTFPPILPPYPSVSPSVSLPIQFC